VRGGTGILSCGLESKRERKKQRSLTNRKEKKGMVLEKRSKLVTMNSICEVRGRGKGSKFRSRVQNCVGRGEFSLVGLLSRAQNKTFMPKPKTKGAGGRQDNDR